jgi:cytochrome c oxidase assembly protein subunit 16
MSFSSKPLNSSGAGLNSFLRRNPAFFGIPFIIIIVGASFGMKSFTEVGVEKKDGKVTTVSLVIFEIRAYSRNSTYV